MQDKIILAIDALASAAFIEGGVSPENTQAARDLTEQRKGELLAAIGAPCLHQIQEPEDGIWPCVNIDVDESGNITNAKLYSPGLPAGNHDVYPVRVPYMDEHTEAWRACVDELEKAVPGFMSLGNMNGIECAVAAIRGLSERAKHQEPAAAEQAAWHAGLDEGRAQTAPAAVAVPDERAAFDDFFRKRNGLHPDTDTTFRSDAAEPWRYWQARAALAATPAVPAGWKLVPVQVPDSAFPWVTPSGKFTTPLFAAPQAQAFQQRVQPWMMACFGHEISADRSERNHRFLEEALELVQSCGCTDSEAHQLVEYVFGRPVGDPMQEAGGVMVTLAALCLANDLDMHACGETELARIWTKVEAIRAKQAAKPKHSPLPMHVAQADARDAERYRFIVEKKLILSGGAEQFGWPIAPFGGECDRYIDAAIAAAKGEA